MLPAHFISYANALHLALIAHDCVNHTPTTSDGAVIARGGLGGIRVPVTGDQLRRAGEIGSIGRAALHQASEAAAEMRRRSEAA